MYRPKHLGLTALVSLHLTCNLVPRLQVPLNERGMFISLLGCVWALASAIGPISGGALASYDWRYLFYLNRERPLSFSLATYSPQFLDLRWS